ncbi:hypothetical protein AVEN_249668-1 [Araneus ventricosus]|uniref:Uncharacterized protein n=1 Tax=Araneus ventricosus TaxID=182803 RepID=A0A4Y2PDB2_ARAVE|nr:hypothetical protein AVEN_249668-1 [Araneus ventricosus]
MWGWSSTLHLLSRDSHQGGGRGRLEKGPQDQMSYLSFDYGSKLFKNFQWQGKKVTKERVTKTEDRSHCPKSSLASQYLDTSISP